MKRRGTLFIISGTSQVGKSTVAASLKRARGLNITNIRTNTTRPMRPEDKRSRQYHFRTVPEFKRLIRHGELLEWAKVHGYYYGTPRADVERALSRGRNVTLVIDVQGARQVKKLKPDTVTIFITAESTKELKRRIMQSLHIPQDQKRARWQSTLKELRAAKSYDYAVINRWGKLDETVDRVCRLIRRHGT